MIHPQTNYIICNNQVETYRMYYTAWGIQDKCNKTLLCLHGLNRNSRDWDYIAQYFVDKGYFIVAPDIVGRGNSNYLKDFKGYDTQYYVNDVLNLINILELKNIDFIGTSMGGLIGMAIASEPNTASYINRLILNDIGAEIEFAGLLRIGSYSSNQPEFNTYLEIKKYLIGNSLEFGDLPEAVWENFTINSVQKNSNKKYELKRDVNISKLFANVTSNKNNILLWEYWGKINTPTLIIHGEKSDILSLDTINKMKHQKPQVQSYEIKNTGHAPFLYNHEHFTMIENFLLG